MAPFGSTPFASAPFGGGPLAGGPGPQPGAPSGLSLRIGPLVTGTSYLFYNSWRLHRQLNGRDTVSCTLLASDGYLPVLGQAFRLEQDGGRLFNGSIFDLDTKFIADGINGWLVHELACVDRNSVCDRRVIGEIYTNKSLGFIVRDIVARTIGQEGITADGVEEGPVLDRVIFPNIPVADAYNLLSARTGFYWYVDYYDTLHFFARNTSLAPFPIVNDANAVLKWRKFRNRESLAQYRNSQLVDGGQAVSLAEREVLASDGQTRTYTCGGDLAERPSLDLNGVPIPPEQLGLRGQEEGKVWYWELGKPSITRDAALAPLPATDLLGVTRRIYFDLDVKLTDFAKVAERALVEGGTGLYEHVHSETSLDGEEVITAKGEALLNRYGLSREKEFELDQAGLDVGQQVSVTVPEIGAIDELHLITELDIESLLPDLQRYTVRCSTGELKSTFTEFWKKALGRNPVRINPEAVVQSVVPIYDEATIEDEVTVLLADLVPAEWGTAVMGEDEWE